jgi:hypothetical protein
MSNEAQYDLTTTDGLLQYLSTNTSFAPAVVTRCTGGMGNFTFRIHLATPYEGRNTLIVKHGKPYLPADSTFALPLSRQVRR